MVRRLSMEKEEEGEEEEAEVEEVFKMRLEISRLLKTLIQTWIKT
jgi:hypothetical protein